MLSSTYYISKLVGTLIVSWLTLGWQVRRARKAFEAELRKEGISEKDASRISSCYSGLKDQFSLGSMMSYYRQARKHEKP